MFLTRSGILQLVKFLIPPTKEGYMFCLSVCLSVSKITQKRGHGFDEMLRVDRCRDMDELINF